MSTSVRFYQNLLPAVDDLVMVKIKDRTEYGYNLELLEYSNTPAFVTLAELSRKTRHKKKNIVNIGEVYPMTVITVDQNKNSINLSKKYMTDEIVAEEAVNYSYKCKLQLLGLEVYHLYSRWPTNKQDLDLKPEDVLSHTLWPLYQVLSDEDISAEQIFSNILEDPHILFTHSAGFFPQDFINKMVANIRSRIHKEDVVVDMLCKIIILTEGGVDLLIQTLTNIQALKFDAEYPNYKIKLEMVSSPTYRVSVKGESVEKCTDLVGIITDKIKQDVSKLGMFNVSQEATVVLNTGTNTGKFQHMTLQDLETLTL